MFLTLESYPYPQLIGITDGYLSLLQDSGEVREDLKMPEGDLGKEIESKYEAGEEILVNAFGSTLPYSITLVLLCKNVLYNWWTNCLPCLFFRSVSCLQ